jgi:hypothetical protein
MATIAPILLTSGLVTDVLTKIRRGVALCRMENTADFSRGVMCDLPEKIDFELNLVTQHQSLSRSTTTTDSENMIIGEGVIEELRSGAKTSGDGKAVSGENEKSQNSSREISQETGADLERASQIEIGQSASRSSSQDGSREGTRTDGTENEISQRKEESKTERKSQSKDQRKEQSKGFFDEQSGDRGNKSDNSLETECSDKCITTRISRNYWRLDEDTGGIQQAS